MLIEFCVKWYLVTLKACSEACKRYCLSVSLFDFTESNQGLGCVKKIFLFGFFPLKLIFPAENEWISINSRIYFKRKILEKFSFVNLYCVATLETTESQVIVNKKL